MTWRPQVLWLAFLLAGVAIFSIHAGMETPTGVAIGGLVAAIVKLAEAD